MIGIDDEAPYWQRHYGIGRRWTPTARGRKGCLLLLFAALAVIIIALVIGGLFAVIG